MMTDNCRAPDYSVSVINSITAQTSRTPRNTKPYAEPATALEPPTYRLQEAFTPRICCLALKILHPPLPLAVLHGWQRMEFMDKTMDNLPPVPGPRRRPRR